MEENEQRYERYWQLPPPAMDLLLPKNPEQVTKLLNRLIFLLRQFDVNIPENYASLTFYKILILSELINFGKVDLGTLTFEIRQKRPNTFSKPDFRAALYVVYDWISTGGKNAAEIGEGLE